jgi:hypothetical protein
MTAESEAQKSHRMAGMELIALALPAASPIVVMVMSVPANRAVKHFALLGAECLIERFKCRLRGLQSQSTRGCNLAEVRLPLHDCRVRSRPKRALPTQCRDINRPRDQGGSTCYRPAVLEACPHRAADVFATLWLVQHYGPEETLLMAAKRCNALRPCSRSRPFRTIRSADRQGQRDGGVSC